VLYLLLKLKPSKFNRWFLALGNIPIKFGLGQIVAYINIKLLSYSSRTDILMFFIFLVYYLFLYHRILIEICKFLIKKQKRLILLYR
jgi:hypothetical protein